jgi:hypothetical protein
MVQTASLPKSQKGLFVLELFYQRKHQISKESTLSSIPSIESNKTCRKTCGLNYPIRKSLKEQTNDLQTKIPT